MIVAIRHYCSPSARSAFAGRRGAGSAGISRRRSGHAAARGCRGRASKRLTIGLSGGACRPRWRPAGLELTRRRLWLRHVPSRRRAVGRIGPPGHGRSAMCDSEFISRWPRRVRAAGSSSGSLHRRPPVWPTRSAVSGVARWCTSVDGVRPGVPPPAERAATARLGLVNASTPRVAIQIEQHELDVAARRQAIEQAVRHGGRADRRVEQRLEHQDGRHALQASLAAAPGQSHARKACAWISGGLPGRRWQGTQVVPRRGVSGTTSIHGTPLLRRWGQAD